MKEFVDKVKELKRENRGVQTEFVERSEMGVQSKKIKQKNREIQVEIKLTKEKII